MSKVKFLPYNTILRGWAGYFANADFVGENCHAASKCIYLDLLSLQGLILSGYPVIFI